LDWVRGKQRWGLAYENAAEKFAVIELLDTCPNTPVRTDHSFPVDSAPVATSTTTTATSTTMVPTGDPEARLVSCSRRGETVVAANDGASPLAMNGFRLHDEGAKHSCIFESLSLPPGGTLMIATGRDGTVGQSTVVWKNQQVWNNDGDTAFLVTPEDPFYL
jgi:competence protein ComEC